MVVARSRADSGTGSNYENRSFASLALLYEKEGALFEIYFTRRTNPTKQSAHDDVEERGDNAIGFCPVHGEVTGKCRSCNTKMCDTLKQGEINGIELLLALSFGFKLLWFYLVLLKPAILIIDVHEHP